MTKQNILTETRRPTGALLDLLAYFGIHPENVNDLKEIVESLEQIFSEKPDGKKPETKKIVLNPDPEVIDRHFKLCGITTETIPQKWKFDYAIWPAFGGVKEVYFRLQDLVKAWRQGVRWNKTFIVAGEEKLKSGIDVRYVTSVCPGLEVNGKEHELWEQIKVHSEMDFAIWLWKTIELPRELKEERQRSNKKPHDMVYKRRVHKIVSENPEEALLGSVKTAGNKNILISCGSPFTIRFDELTHRENQCAHIEVFGHSSETTGIGTCETMRELIAYLKLFV